MHLHIVLGYSRNGPDAATWATATARPGPLPPLLRAGLRCKGSSHLAPGPLISALPALATPPTTMGKLSPSQVPLTPQFHSFSAQSPSLYTVPLTSQANCIILFTSMQAGTIHVPWFPTLPSTGPSPSAQLSGLGHSFLISMVSHIWLTSTPQSSHCLPCLLPSIPNAKPS